MKNLFSLFLLMISSTYLSMAFNYDIFSRGIPGGGFFPIIIGVILVLLTGFDLIKNFRLNKDSKQAYNRSYLIDMVVMIGITAVFMFLFNLIGAILSTFVFMAGILAYLNRDKWVQNILISVCTPLIIFFMFEVLLSTGLPKGIFENWI